MNEATNTIGDQATACRLQDQVQRITMLMSCAISEKGFTPGLLACVRARAAALTADILALTLPSDKSPAPEAEATVQEKKATPRVPRPYRRATKEIVYRVLDLAGKGMTDEQVADEVGCSPDNAYRIRRRDRSRPHLHRWIDSWKRAQKKAGAK